MRVLVTSGASLGKFLGRFEQEESERGREGGPFAGAAELGGRREVRYIVDGMLPEC